LILSEPSVLKTAAWCIMVIGFLSILVFILHASRWRKVLPATCGL
jgi:hypothetical protein